MLLEPLTQAVSAGTLKLARVDTGEILPIAITQPVGPGLSNPRRLVVKLTSEEESWPETGTLLQVTLPAAALVDLFGNVATSGAAESFAWKAGDVVLDDAVAPRVQRVCVSGGHLEIELSEEAKLADLATAIQVNGAPIAWNLAGGGYLLVSADVLPAGSYTLSIGTQSLDLAGLGLAESFQRSFTLSAGETRKQIYLRSLPGFASTSTIGNLFGFHGQPLDPETGLVYIRNRYYDPELGRFITTDPMGYGDGPNLYQYGLNNPANFSDPTGETVGLGAILTLGVDIAFAAWDTYQFATGGIDGGEYALRMSLTGASLLAEVASVGSGGGLLVQGARLARLGRKAEQWARRAGQVAKAVNRAELAYATAQAALSVAEGVASQEYGRALLSAGQVALYLSGFRNQRDTRFIGEVGESATVRMLRRKGYTDVIQIQNASGHGIDIVARNRHGELRFFEVKSTFGNEPPRLSRAQNDVEDFVTSRLERAASGSGSWANVDKKTRDVARNILDEINSGKAVRGAIIEVRQTLRPFWRNLRPRRW